MNVEELDKIAKQQRIKQGEIEKALGISHTAWYKKRKGISDITLSEMQTLAKFLRMTNAETKVIFNLP